MAFFEIHQAYLKMRMKLKLVSFPCKISTKFVKQFTRYMDNLTYGLMQTMMGYIVVQSAESEPTSQRNMSPLSPGLKPAKQETSMKQPAGKACGLQKHGFIWDFESQPLSSHQLYHTNKAKQQEAEEEELRLAIQATVMQRNKGGGAEVAWVGCRHAVRDKDKDSEAWKDLG